MGPKLRYGLLAGTLALAAVAFVGLVGKMALSESGKAARAGSFAKSESQARRAATWSPEPWRRVGEAQLARGELAAARDGQRPALELVLLAAGAAALVLLLGRPLRVTRAQAGPESLIR